MKLNSEAAQPATERQVREAEMIRLICAGNRELYYDLIRDYQRAVFMTARVILRNDADAEEVAQETFLKALRYLPSFRGESRFSTWLERIAVNEARMRLRRSRTEKFDSIDEQAEGEDGPYVPLILSDWREIPSESLERKEVRELLQRAIAQLAPRYREVLVLRDIEEKSIAETAELLGLTIAAVKTRLLRARLQLRDLVAPVQQNGEPLSRNPFKKGRKPWS